MQSPQINYAKKYYHQPWLNSLKKANHNGWPFKGINIFVISIQFGVYFSPTPLHLSLLLPATALLR